MRVTIFRSIYQSKEPYVITLNKALQRIKDGASKDKVCEIRECIDKEKRDLLKKHLPSVLFAGVFDSAQNEAIKEYSNLMILDFDNLSTDMCEQKKIELSQNEYVYACWTSPSGNGIKALVRIANGKKHMEHFKAIQDIFSDLDKSGINIARHCFESYDPNIYINVNSKVFTKVKKIEYVKEKQEVTDKEKNFDNILKWLANKGNAFVTGERNLFVYKLAGACCRFGIEEETTYFLCKNRLGSDSTFTDNELNRTIKSAYKSNKHYFGTATFENDILVSKETYSELEVDVLNSDIYNLDIKPKDVYFGEDLKHEAIELYTKGYENLKGVGIDDLDNYFKPKKGEITLLTGIGNYGKSSFLKWYLLLRALKHGEKFALFTPEDNPAVEFYHDLTEIYLGCDCTPRNYNRPSQEIYSFAYDFVSKHFFYVYPKELAPTPEYVKERFLELIIKERVSGCIIDPFNQMSNDYGKSGGRSDKYLETLLSDFSRFAQSNNIYFTIVAHPKLMRKNDSGNYPCPDVFDVADGAMWNNKMDNILVYHRPVHQTNPQDNVCELHTKKIRRQKTVGKKGTVIFDLDRHKRRFMFNNIDYLGIFLNEAESIQNAFAEENNFWNDIKQDNEPVPF